MDDYERPTGAIIAELSAASDERRKTVLQDLTGTRGYRQDWADFWTRLQSAEAAEKVWTHNKPELRALALRSCRVDQYQALARFLVSRNEGWDWIIGPNQVCKTALGPELAVWLISYLADHPTTVSPLDLITFFSFELQAEPNPQTWLPYWNLAIEEQLAKVYHSLAQTDAAARARLRIAFRSVWNRELIGSIRGILENPIDLDRLMEEVDSVQALQYILRLARTEPPPKKLVGMIAFERMVLAAFGQQASLDKHWLHYLLLRNLLSHCATNWEVSETLLHRDQLMKGFAKRLLREGRPIEVTAFFRARLGQSWDAPTFLDLATFAFTIEGSQSAFAKELRSRALENSEPAASIEESLLRQRFEIVWARDAGTRAVLIKRFCDTLRTAGARTGALVPLAELESLSSVPGCFVVKAKNLRQLQAQHAIELSFLSAVELHAEELVISSPEFYAGVIQVPDGGRVRILAKKLGMPIEVPVGSADLTIKRED